MRDGGRQRRAHVVNVGALVEHSQHRNPTAPHGKHLAPTNNHACYTRAPPSACSHAADSSSRPCLRHLPTLLSPAINSQYRPQQSLQLLQPRPVSPRSSIPHHPTTDRQACSLRQEKQHPAHIATLFPGFTRPDADGPATATSQDPAEGASDSDGRCAGSLRLRQRGTCVAFTAGTDH